MGEISGYNRDFCNNVLFPVLVVFGLEAFGFMFWLGALRIF